MRKLLLCLALVAGSLMLPTPPKASAIGPLLPYCIEYCCNPAVPDTQQCWYNGQIKTCAWFRQPGHSACL